MTRSSPPSFDLLVLFVLFVPLFLLSCDSSGSNDENDGFSLDKGSFSATIEEDGETSSISGGAVFGVVEDIPDRSGFLTQNFDGKAFAIYMLDGERTLDADSNFAGQFVHAALSKPSTSIPDEGQYTLFEDNGLIFSLVDQRDGLTSLGGAFATSPGPGELKITSKSDNELKGTFRYESNDLNIQVTDGSFTAVRVDNMDEIVRCAPGCDD